VGFLGVNPKRNARLDALGKPHVSLLGIPAPYGIPSTFGVLGSSALEDLIAGLSKRREALGPRVNRQELLLDEKRQIDALTRDTFGTDQQPIMLLFGEALFSAFIPDLMSSDELQVFTNMWTVRGITPAKISAIKHGRHWTYGRRDNSPRA
jgi:hypothetical protein